MIGGARSPITTKNAIHVPPRKPIIETSMANLPAAPNTLKAKNKCVHIKSVSTARITAFFTISQRIRRTQGYSILPKVS